MSYSHTYPLSRSDARQAVEQHSHAHATHHADSLRGPPPPLAMRSGGTAPVVQGLFEQPCACKFIGCKCTVRTTQDICVMVRPPLSLHLATSHPPRPLFGPELISFQCSKGHHDL